MKPDPRAKKLRNRKNPILSDKYIAGFIDADGSIGINVRGTRMVPTVTITQKTSRDLTLHLLRDQFGGHLQYKKDNGYDRTVLYMNGKKYLHVLERLLPHLVLKQAVCRLVIGIVTKRESAENVQESVKNARKLQGKHRNFPTRKWLAGYIDGDGCFTGRVSRSGSFRPKFKVSAAEYDRHGVDLIRNSFGGNIREITPKNEKHTELVQYELHLSASKIKKFLSYFAKNLVIKRSQADYLISCANKLKGFKDGTAIKQMLKQLKAQEQRLSERAA